MQALARQVNLEPIRKAYVNLVHNLRNTGIKVSDRRAVKIQNLIAASAVMCGRSEAILTDLWVLKYIWDTEEQIEILAGLIDRVIENENQEGTHPQAFFNKVPNAEELMKEVQLLTGKWDSGQLSFEEQNVIKDKLRYVQTRAGWIKNSEHKEHLANEIESLWHRMLQTV